MFIMALVILIATISWFAIGSKIHTSTGVAADVLPEPQFASWLTHVDIDRDMDAYIRSSAGVGTHIYITAPGKGNNMSFDCGAEINLPQKGERRVRRGRSMLGDHIFLTHLQQDHVAALFSSLVNSRRPRATYTIYVPPSDGRANMIRLTNTFQAMNQLNQHSSDNADDLGDEVRLQYAYKNIIIREARGDMVVSANNYIVRAWETDFSVDSCGYTVYSSVCIDGGDADVLDPGYIQVGSITYKPVVTVSGDTMANVWSDNKPVADVTFAECTRFTGLVSEIHKHMHTHIDDLEQLANDTSANHVDWSNTRLYLYHVAPRENDDVVNSVCSAKLGECVVVCN